MHIKYKKDQKMKIIPKINDIDISKKIQQDITDLRKNYINKYEKDVFFWHFNITTMTIEINKKKYCGIDIYKSFIELSDIFLKYDYKVIGKFKFFIIDSDMTNYYKISSKTKNNKYLRDLRNKIILPTPDVIDNKINEKNQEIILLKKNNKYIKRILYSYIAVSIFLYGIIYKY